MYVAPVRGDVSMRSRRPIPDFFRYGQASRTANDGCHSPTHGQSSEVEQHMSDELMPQNDVILREFEEYLEIRSPMSEEEEEKLRKLSIEEKWKMVFSQDKHVGFHPVKKYIDGLQIYAETRRRSSGSLHKNMVTGCSYWLRKLKVDLKRLPDSFVEEFIEKPNRGMSLLLRVLKQILKEQERLQSIRKSSSEILKNSLLDQLDCLLCIKFALKSKASISALLDNNGAVWEITLCLMSNFRKISLTVIEILTLICNERTGYLHVTDAITTLRVKNMESVRFKLLTSMLHSQASHHFQAVCVRFFNKLLSCTDDANAKVYLQHELEQAGFDPDAFDRHSLGQNAEFSELQKELDVWRKNYINVDRDREELYQQQNRGLMLRNEIDRLQAQLKEAEAATEKEKKLRLSAEAHFNKLRENAAEMQDVLGRIIKLCKEDNGIDISKEIPDLERFYKPLDGYATVKDKFGTLTSSKSQSISSLDQVVLPPPAPPMMPPTYLSNTIRRKVDSHANLPMLNWTPMYSVRNTLFEDIDDEAKLRDIDFTEFDQIFQLPIKEVESRDRGERIVQRSAKLITCVEMSKSRNMIITIKRTGLSHKELRTAIDSFQLDMLPGEYAELLLKYVPTKEELKCLAKHAQQYEKMGEAEKYLFQMTKVQRLERKLSLMAFMGKFDDVIKNISPEIELIQKSSELLLKSLKLKKVFELVLAFGNYMNSMKKGYAVGFRLESLSKLQDVKSGDKSKTLLHYLAHFIETRYPELMGFEDELELSLEKGVSYQSVASDVLSLRRGMDLLRSELEKQPNNQILKEFHAMASPQVAETADRFRKMEEMYKNTCTYFGEDYQQMEPDELVRYIADFVAAFKKAAEENHKKSETEAPPKTVTQRRQESVYSHKDAKSGQVKAVHKPADKQEVPKLSRINTNQHLVNNANDAYSKNDAHVTVIKVANDDCYKKLGAGHYSELPLERLKSPISQLAEQQSLTRHVSYANTGDIKLSKSNSFVYYAKTSDKESAFAKVSKRPSTNAEYANNNQVTDAYYDATEPARLYKNGDDVGQQNAMSLLHKEPVYDEIFTDHVSDKRSVAAPTMSNGSCKSNSETGSVTTNSLSSMSTSPTNTSGSTSAGTKAYTVTDEGADSGRDFAKRDRKMSAASVLYKQQVNEVINKLDQLLEDESPDAAVAPEDEISYL